MITKCLLDPSNRKKLRKFNVQHVHQRKFNKITSIAKKKNKLKISVNNKLKKIASVPRKKIHIINHKFLDPNKCEVKNYNHIYLKNQIRMKILNQFLLRLITMILEGKVIKHPLISSEANQNNHLKRDNRVNRNWCTKKFSKFPENKKYFIK